MALCNKIQNRKANPGKETDPRKIDFPLFQFAHFRSLPLRPSTK